jgi:hypothetical protein
LHYGFTGYSGGIVPKVLPAVSSQVFRPPALA